jgi:hypothetical protein
MFRVSREGQGIDDADTIDEARGVVRVQSPGRYEVDDIRGDPFPSGHSSRSAGARSPSTTTAESEDNPAIPAALQRRSPTRIMYGSSGSSARGTCKTWAC